MSKKKIAVFATGWASEILYQYLVGVRDGLDEGTADLYLFLSHPTYSDDGRHFQGEVNIFKLPHMEDFDGALVFANGIDFPEVIGDIKKRCEDAAIPVVYTGNDKLGGYFVGSDNYVGARKMCDHLIEEHGVKSVIFIAGSRDNMDSNTRLKALKDALGDYGYELPEENIFYSNWGPTISVEFLKEYFAQGKTVDAVVCANDTLAMIICSEMQEAGHKIPEELIVTGFDNDPYAQVYDPAISSVDQRFDKIGEKSISTLMKVLAGIEVERHQTIPCEFVPSESCGCMAARDFSSIRKALGRNRFLTDTKGIVFDQHLFSMEKIIMQGKCYEDLKRNLGLVHESFKDYQGDVFHIVFDHLFEETISNQERQLRKSGYAEEMDAIFSVCNGNVISNPKFKSRLLVPQQLVDNKNHQYIFLPLHEDDSTMGYVVFCDDFGKVKEDLYIRKYTDRFNIILGKFLRDLRVDVLHSRLMDLTETDALTHVKNRTAYKARQERIEKRIRSDEGLQFAVAVFDVNNLKKINDRLGHEAGDDYIINCCRVVCRVFKKSAVYRIGGDEFAVVMEGDDYEHRNELMQELRTRMEQMQTVDGPEYKKVSIASGMADFDRQNDRDYAEVFARADAAMYANKKEMKMARPE